jgi:hypothetical protein
MIPTVNDLTVDPELSALAMLETALAVAVHALEAANPDLDRTAKTWASPPPVAIVALGLIVHGRYVLVLIEDSRLSTTTTSSESTIRPG